MVFKELVETLEFYYHLWWSTTSWWWPNSATLALRGSFGGCLKEYSGAKRFASEMLLLRFQWPPFERIPSCCIAANGNAGLCEFIKCIVSY